MIPSFVSSAPSASATPGRPAQHTAPGAFDFAFLAAPMSLLLGNIANVSGATDRLFDAATSAIGHVRGSLGYVNITTSFGFSWMSGAAISDAAAMGRIQVPEIGRASCRERVSMQV